MEICAAILLTELGDRFVLLLDLWQDTTRFILVLLNILVGRTELQAITPSGPVNGVLNYLVLSLARIENDPLQNNETLCVWLHLKRLVWPNLLFLLLDLA